MTKAYNVSKSASARYYYTALRKAGLYESPAQTETAQQIHDKFFIFLDQRLPQFLYRNGQTPIDLEAFHISEGGIPQFYYTLVQTKDRRVTFNHITDKYSIPHRTPIRDEIKTTRAAPANVAHYLDATVVRIVTEQMLANTVHDMFMVTLGDVHILLDTVNRYYAARIPLKTTYAVFILL